MKKLIALGLLCLAFSSHAHLCTKFEGREDMELVLELAEKLMYSPAELCQHQRIMDIQPEVRSYYYQDSDEFEDHKVLTLHYNEYSCEYHFNLVREEWMDARNYCYNTW